MWTVSHGWGFCNFEGGKVSGFPQNKIEMCRRVGLVVLYI